jgi:tetratricopeptide (TPR) repeat protein
VNEVRLLFLVFGCFILSAGNIVFASESPDSEFGRFFNSGRDITAGHSNGYAMDEYGAIELNNRSARMLFLEAQENMRSGDIETALRKIRRSLNIDNDDMDAHCLYAELMEDKLRNQAERDPELFNCCIEEWLAVMRNRYGEEKGMRFKGINPCGDLFHDDERSIVAKRALVKLTGFSPKTFETDNHYLKRVLLPSTDKVAGTVVGQKSKVQVQ